MPAEVYETRTPLIMHRKELLADSGGAGRWRGGLAMQTESSYRGDGYWGVSTIIDRLKFAGQGIAGGKPGAIGEYVLDTGEHPPAKMLVPLALDDHVHLRLRGRRRLRRAARASGRGGAARRGARLRHDRGGRARVRGRDPLHRRSTDRLVRLPEHYAIDADATARLRAT